MIEINNLEEMQKYYNKNTNTYEFMENGRRLDVKFNFDIDVESNIIAGDIKAKNIKSYGINACDIKSYDINAWDISALNINAKDIIACDIDVWDINANNISVGNISAKNIKYGAVCYACNDIECDSITSEIANSKHFVLDGNLIVDGKCTNITQNKSKKLYGANFLTYDIEEYKITDETKEYLICEETTPDGIKEICIKKKLLNNINSSCYTDLEICAEDIKKRIIEDNESMVKYFKYTSEKILENQKKLDKIQKLLKEIKGE